jgi:pimeloyl-ACP methyl ester carboxylesterase
VSADTVTIRSGDDDLVGHLWLPDGDGPHPLVVLGHGLGAVQDMGLATYASHFSAHGLAALTFDYRGFGESGGTPRQVIDIGRQLDDWQAAVAAGRARPEIDAERVALWGTSFAGGHVLEVAKRDPSIAAVVAQCPFTDGPASVGKVHPGAAAQLTARALADQAAAWLGRDPVTVPVYGPPGTAALLAADDCEEGYAALVPRGSTFRNQVGARIALQVLTYRPGRALADVRCPVLLCLCEHDSVAPAAAARRHAARHPDAEVATYECGHFDIYREPWIDQAVVEQTTFLLRSLHLGD